MHFNSCQKPDNLTKVKESTKINQYFYDYYIGATMIGATGLALTPVAHFQKYYIEFSNFESKSLPGPSILA
jgi:hypothetical protein